MISRLTHPVTVACVCITLGTIRLWSGIVDGRLTLDLVHDLVLATLAVIGWTRYALAEDTLLDQTPPSEDVQTVVAAYKMRRIPGGEYIGLSPFAAERTPSFYILRGGHRWYDFASGKTGDVTDLAATVRGTQSPSEGAVAPDKSGGHCMS